MSLFVRFDVGDVISDTTVSGREAVLATLALIASWVLGRLARRATLRVLDQVAGISEDLRQLAARLAKYLVWLLGIGVALGFLGAAVQPFLTAALLVAVVLVIALRSVADNFAAGIVIQTRRPVQLDDRIEAMGFSGIVTEVNSRAVLVETSDGRTVHLPNARLLDGPIVNDSEHGARRTDIEIRAGRRAGEALSDVLAMIAREAAGADGVVSDPEPSLFVRATDHARLVALLRIWHAPGDGDAAGSAAIEAVGAALEADGREATIVTPPPPPGPVSL